MERLQITLEVLKKAGWYEGRKINVDYIQEFLINRGYEIFPPVKAFLEEFGMIEIMDGETNIFNRDRFHTDTKRTIGDYLPQGSLKAEEQYARERLVPVGEIRNGYLRILISESGKMYCDTGKLGNDFGEGWESIITHNGFRAWGSFD